MRIRIVVKAKLSWADNVFPKLLWKMLGKNLCGGSPTVRCGCCGDNGRPPRNRCKSVSWPTGRLGSCHSEAFIARVAVVDTRRNGAGKTRHEELFACDHGCAFGPW